MNSFINNQPYGVYNAKELGTGRMLLLGMQHTFAMFGATVLVPLLTGLNVSTTLLMAGLGTLLFHLVTKRKVPAFLGSSFAFLGGYASVAPLIDGKPNTEMLPYACGGVFAAGLIYLIAALLIKTVGIRKIMRFFPPVVTGPIIISIGLILAPGAIDNCRQNWFLAITAIVAIIICNIWGRGIVRIIPIMLGIIVSYILAVLMGQVDFSGITSSLSNGIIGGLFAIPVQREAFAKFDISAMLTIAPIALATMMEHVGDISAISATTKKNYLSDPGLHRTLIGDGLATMMASFFGGPANTTYGENTGVLALSKVFDPLVVRIAAVFAIILSFVPAFAEIIRSIPASIVGGVSLILYGMISAVGIRNLIDNQVDFTKSRNLIITAVILVCALGFNFSDVTSISFTVGGTTISLSGLAIASIAGIALNMILPGNDFIFDDKYEDD